MTKTCPVCRKRFYHHNNLNAQRGNVGCSDKCKTEYKTMRQRDRRKAKRLLRLTEEQKQWALQQVRLTKKRRRPGPLHRGLARERWKAVQRKAAR